MMWRNWGRSQRAERELQLAVTVDDVVQVVERARDSRRSLRPVGSGHSFSAAARPDDLHLDLSGMRGVLSVDRDRGTARLLAGTVVAEAAELLAPYGLAFENLGDIDRQTIAGAISTGTHGTGLRFRSIGASVVGATIVTGTGEVLHVSETSRPDLLPAVRLGLGALGVLVDVTIQCVPAFRLSAVEHAVSLDAVLDDWRGLAERTDHFEAYWFPGTSIATTKSNTRGARLPLAPRSRARRIVQERVAEGIAYRALVAGATLAPAVAPTVRDIAARGMARGAFTESAHDVFVSHRPVRFREMEYAVPLDAARDVVTAIAAAIDRARLTVTFPVELRVLGADDAYLSTASGRESTYVAVHRYWREDPRPLFDLVEPILLAHDGRPHWGKLHSLRAPQLAERFPGYASFLRARDELDPERVFASAWTRRVLGD